MIAKLVTHAPNRAAAIDAQSKALDSFVVDGIGHNMPFLSALMQHPRWRAGKLSTGFIKEEYPDGFRRQSPTGDIEDTLVAVAAAIDHLSNTRRRKITQQMSGQNVRFARRRVVAIGRDLPSRHRRGRPQRSDHRRVPRHRRTHPPGARCRVRNGGPASRCGTGGSATATSPSR